MEQAKIYLTAAIISLCFQSGWGVDCPDPGGVSNGERIMTPDGSTVTYTCNQGYRLSVGNDAYIRVKDSANGCWNGTTPFCNRINCGDPGRVLHSTREGSKFRYNDEVSYKCDYGFRLQDSSRTITITCQANGKWDKSGATLFCTKVKCPTVMPVSRGMPPQGTYYYGDTVTYPCLEGYRRINNFTVLTCLESGFWDGSFPQCEAEACSDPGEPENSQRISLSGLQFGDTLMYKCMEGYDPYPHKNALYGTCMTTGWTNAQLKCKGVLCPPKEYVYNSTHTNTTWRYPETVTFTCDPGFQTRFEGNQNDEITCQLNSDPAIRSGVWDYQPITCERVICTDTGEARFVEIAADVFKYTDKKVYKCLGGYIHKSGDISRRCEADGRFSGTAPTCKRVGCADPGPFDYSNRTVSGLLFGDIISYTCFNGYIVGNRSGILDQRAICTNAGLWNPPLEACRAAVCGQPDSQGLMVIGTSFKFSDEVEFLCKVGYIPQDTDMTRRCQANGLWDGDPPLCTRKSCGDPGSVANSQKLGTKYIYEAEVFYQCDSGYIIYSGLALLKCTANGTWDLPLPVCDRIKCPKPEWIDNSFVLPGHAVTYQSMIQYGCLDGFAKLPDSGPLNRMCESTGMWSGKPPECDRISCGFPGTAPFSYLTGSSYMYGDKVNYSCVLGHTTEFRISYKIKTCNEFGKWVDADNLDTDIVCEPIECTNPRVKNRTVQKMEDPSQRRFYFHSTVKYLCTEDYMIRGKRELYCQHTGLWDAPVPECVPIPVVEVGPTVQPVKSDPVEAPDADQYGMVCVLLMAIEWSVLVLLDLLTLSRDLKMLARNVRAGWHRVRPKVSPMKTDDAPPLTDADLDMYLNEPWAYRVESPSDISTYGMGSSTTSLSDSCAELVPSGRANLNRPSTAARRLQVLAGLSDRAGSGMGDKKKKIIIG